jgi:hypothetical protein
MSAAPTIALLVVVAIVVAVACQTLVDLLFRPNHLEAAQQAAGDLFIQPVSGLYGVLVAFLRAAALAGYQNLRGGIAIESNALADLIRIADLLPPPVGYEIRAAALEYTRSVITDEWPRMAEGSGSTKTSAALANLWRQVQTFAPQTSAETNIQALALDLVKSITLQRQLRILAATRSIPIIVWVILGFGAVISIVLSTFSAPPRLFLRHAFVAMLAVMIALTLYALYVLSQPFGAAIPLISPERLLQAQEMLQELQ